MKKLFIVLIILVQTLVLASCKNQLKEDARTFIDQFDTSGLISEYKYDEVIYGLYLSSTSETVYQFKIKDSHYYINVLEERSYSQYDTETEINEYNEAKNVKHMYYINTDNKNLYIYDQELSIYMFVKELEIITIDYIVTEIHNHLEKEGVPISFSDLYPVINEVLRVGKEYGEMSFFGDYNVKTLTLTISKDDFLLHANEFKKHLLTIYGIDKYEKVLESYENSHYDNLHIEFEWDTEKNIILPNFVISFMNIEYYKLSVDAEAFTLNPDFK